MGGWDCGLLGGWLARKGGGWEGGFEGQRCDTIDSSVWVAPARSSIPPCDRLTRNWRAKLAPKHVIGDI